MKKPYKLNECTNFWCRFKCVQVWKRWHFCVTDGNTDSNDQHHFFLWSILYSIRYENHTKLSLGQTEKKKIWIFASDAEQSETDSQESIFPPSYGIFKQRNVSETIDFCNMIYGTKNVSFWTLNQYPWWFFLVRITVLPVAQLSPL